MGTTILCWLRTSAWDRILLYIREMYFGLEQELFVRVDSDEYGQRGGGVQEWVLMETRLRPWKISRIYLSNLERKPRQEHNESLSRSIELAGSSRSSVSLLSNNWCIQIVSQSGMRWRGGELYGIGHWGWSGLSLVAKRVVWLDVAVPL